MQAMQKITIRLPLPWYRKLKSEAALRGLTVGRLVQLAVDEWVKNHPVEEEDEHGEKAGQ